MNRIARKNHADFNVPYPKLVPYLKDMLWLRKYSNKLVKG